MIALLPATAQGEEPEPELSPAEDPDVPWWSSRDPTGAKAGPIGDDVTALFAPPPAASPALAAARAALEAKDLPRAAELYAAIKAGTPDWSLKLIDAARMHLLANRHQEAWRVAEVGRRLELDDPFLGYYSKVSALKSGSCATSLDAKPHLFDLLTKAYAFRYASRYRDGRYNGDPYRLAATGRRQTHLAFEFPHFLGDIPKATLISTKGCRFRHGEYADAQGVKRGEKLALVEYVLLSEAKPEDGGFAAPLPGHDAVVLRLLALALADKDKETIAEVTKRYKDRDAAGWIRVPEPERRFAWQKLIEAGIFAPMPLGEKDPRYETVAQIILATPTPDVAAWLGAVDFDKWSFGRQKELFDKLLAIDGLPMRPRILLRRARLAFEEGDLTGTLGMVRRLTIEPEGEGDDVAMNGALRLAVAIFREHQYDEAMLGAIQGSLPTARWGQVYRAVLLEQALAGSVKAYDRLLVRIKTSRTNAARELSGTSAELLDALARRQFPRFDGIFDALAKTGARPPMPVLRTLTQIAERAAGVTAETRESLKPYQARVATYLREELAKGGTGGNHQALAELLQAFTVEDDAWQKGAAAARRGMTQIGVVDLEQDAALANPYSWNAPSSLPLRDLLAVPDAATKRGWVIR